MACKQFILSILYQMDPVNNSFIQFNLFPDITNNNAMKYEVLKALRHVGCMQGGKTSKPIDQTLYIMFFYIV